MGANPRRTSDTAILKAVSSSKKTAKPASAHPVRALPRSLAACADLLYSAQQERLALDKRSEALKALETQIREHLITNLPKSDATGVAGRLARAHIEMKTVVSVESWPSLYESIVKEYLAHKKRKDAPPELAFLALQKRAGDALIKERWEKGVSTPGIKPLQVPIVSLHKV